ncbi:MAG: hypothetical protein MZU79_01860 [Anaerotruncus sp.]|nr:hypothetical protein [Anaerotruncus sp.]
MLGVALGLLGCHILSSTGLVSLLRRLLIPRQPSCDGLSGPKYPDRSPGGGGHEHPVRTWCRRQGRIAWTLWRCHPGNERCLLCAVSSWFHAAPADSARTLSSTMRRSRFARCSSPSRASRSDGARVCVGVLEGCLSWPAGFAALPRVYALAAGGAVASTSGWLVDRIEGRVGARHDARARGQPDQPRRHHRQKRRPHGPEAFVARTLPDHKDPLERFFRGGTGSDLPRRIPRPG